MIIVLWQNFTFKADRFTIILDINLIWQFRTCKFERISATEIVCFSINIFYINIKQLLITIQDLYF